jgi:hypothetical protein
VECFVLQEFCSKCDLVVYKFTIVELQVLSMYNMLCYLMIAYEFNLYAVTVKKYLIMAYRRRSYQQPGLLF